MAEHDNCKRRVDCQTETEKKVEIIPIERPVSATQKMVTRMEGSSRMKLPQAAKAALASWPAKKFRCISDSVTQALLPFDLAHHLQYRRELRKAQKGRRDCVSNDCSLIPRRWTLQQAQVNLIDA